MKKLSQSIALVAVTTLFATAFTTSYFEQHASAPQLAKTDARVEQVVIIGKRMTALEKAQYDAEVVAQAAQQPINVEQTALKIAVK